MSTLPPLQCQNNLFNWAESIDTKSWSRLASLFTPEISVDYGGVGGFGDISTPEAFVESCSGPPGHPNIITQHFIGACRWKQLSDKKWSVDFQVRVAHWRSPVTEDGASHTVKGHGTNTMEFELCEDDWKISFLELQGRKMEGDIAALLQSKE